MDETLQFADTLFGRMPDGEHYILVWRWPEKLSGWFKDVASAVAFIKQYSSRDVYVGAGLSPKDHGPTLRLKIEGNERLPSALCALWSDLDVLGPGHEKKNLPPTEEAALKILFPGVPPTMLVHSGGGLQAWWVFVEPWTLDTEEEVRRAANLSARWVRALRARGSSSGYDVDSVGDLPRVMRVPGTTNNKIPGHPRPTRLLEVHPERLYHWSDLEEFLDDIGAPKAEQRPATMVTGELVYSEAAEPPVHLFKALYANDTKFERSWEHDRKDFKDQSASAYDMALANAAVEANWNDQDIADLLIAHRRRYKQDLKLRDSYYALTIGKARAAVVSAGALERLEALTPIPRPEPRDEDGELKPKLEKVEVDPLQYKAALTEELSNFFGFVGPNQIIRFTRYTSEPPEFAIQTKQTHIHLNEVRNLITPRLLKEKLAEAGHIIPNYKDDQRWTAIQQKLLSACVDVSLGEESGTVGLADSLLHGYLLSTEIKGEGAAEGDSAEAAFIRNGRVHIYLTDFRRYIRVNYGDKYKHSEVSRMLRRAGAEIDWLHIGTGKNRTSRQVWKLRDGFVVPKKPTSQTQTQTPEWVVDDQVPEVTTPVQ